MAQLSDGLLKDIAEATVYCVRTCASRRLPLKVFAIGRVFAQKNTMKLILPFALVLLTVALHEPAEAQEDGGEETTPMSSTPDPDDEVGEEPEEKKGEVLA